MKAEAAFNTLLDTLTPVRFALQAFLSDGDAVRAMRVNRSLTAAVLVGFRLIRHVFTIRSVEQLQRETALYASYGFLITLMDTSFRFNDCLMGTDGRSLLPPSLIALMLGPARDGWVYEVSMLEAVVDDYQRRCGMARRVEKPLVLAEEATEERRRRSHACSHWWTTCS